MTAKLHIAFSILVLAGVAFAKDPVPGALAQMQAFPGLGEAVTDAVFNNANGRIHGHDATRIEVAVDEKHGQATIKFLMPKTFTIHGDRTLTCLKKDTWSCTEAP